VNSTSELRYSTALSNVSDSSSARRAKKLTGDAPSLKNATTLSQMEPFFGERASNEMLMIDEGRIKSVSK
jgi:hypothetical protein